MGMVLLFFVVFLSIVVPNHSLAVDLYLPRKIDLFNEADNNVEYQDDEYGIWSGNYVGLHISRLYETHPLADTINRKTYNSLLPNGLGIELGHNIQLEDFVFGINCHTTAAKDDSTFYRLKEKYFIYGDVVLKAGYSVDSLLIYGMGGFGGAYVIDSSLEKVESDNSKNAKGRFDGHGSSVVLGIGLDYMVNYDISLSASYRYIPHHIHSVNNSNAKSDVERVDRKGNAHIASLGINMHF
nr:hypothetical protein LOCUS_160 [Candidatus Liberibacter asiaticus]